MVGNPLFSRLPILLQWSVHNIFGHPLSEVFHILGLERLSAWAHDWTMPEHDPS